MRTTIFLSLILSFFKINAQSKYTSDYSKIFCYILKDQTIANQTADIAGSKTIAKKWKGKFKVSSDILPLQPSDFYDAFKQRLDSNQLNNLYDVLKNSFDSLDLQAFNCKSYNRSPFEIYFSDKRYDLIETDIRVVRPVYQSRPKNYKKPKGDGIHILFQIKGDKIIKIASKVFNQ